MGIHQPQGELFSYQVNLEKRVRPDHPLRRGLEVVDLSFVRQEGAGYDGRNGHEPVDPVILLKLMFLLFWDNGASERELMGGVRERLDELWFLGSGLDDEVPNHSVLSRARPRWGREVFERLFVRPVEQCVAAGLVSGDKLHVDASLIAAHASKDAVLKSSPELIARPARRPMRWRKRSSRRGRAPLPIIRRSTNGPGARRIRQANTGRAVGPAVAARKHGTAENFLACQERGIVPHPADAKARQASTRNGRFREKDFP